MLKKDVLLLPRFYSQTRKKMTRVWTRQSRY